MTITPGLDQKLAVILTPTSNPGTSRWAKQARSLRGRGSCRRYAPPFAGCRKRWASPIPRWASPIPRWGLRPHTPTLRAYARRGGIKLNIIIVHASIQAMRGLRPLKLPLTKDPLKWSIEATWRTQLTNRSAGQNVTDNHSDHHSDKHSMFFFPEANPEATVGVAVG